MADCCEATRDGHYDLAVIGAGSAGFSAAITAAETGARVALIGSGTIGGTCVNVGCVPSKTMIRMAEAVHGAATASRFPGVVGEAHVEDWQAAIMGKDSLVADLRRKKYIDLLPAYPDIVYIEGRARFTATGLLVDGAPFHADRIVIATGASPALPDIPGAAAVPYLTSTTALSLPRLPRSLLVIGGGYIGCELAQMFARVGVAVTLVTRRRLLPDAEAEVAQALTGYLCAEGLGIETGLSYRGIAAGDGGIELVVERDGEETTLAAEQVLFATGRRPNTQGLGCAAAGIETAPDGAIVVDSHMRTSRAGIYAAGDVTGRDPFVYMAAYGGKIAARNALEGDRHAYDNHAMPWVVFTDPQLAGVGLGEAQARAAGIEPKVSVLPLDAVPRALAARDTRGMIKLVADRQTDRLVGAQILAPEGSDSIGTAALAIRAGLTTRQLAEMILPYLTTVEGLKLAAQAFEKDIARLSCCAG
ncbi:MAG: mercury(II) reductase [Rhodothalassiaceae bacterium]